VRDCYGSIDDAVLRRALGDRAEGVAAVLRAMWDDGVRGLPVGPEASALVANWVLATVDAAIADAGGVPLRWVDDWAARVRDRPGAAAVLRALERALANLGLALHPGKTVVVPNEGHGPSWVAASPSRARDRGMMPRP
jgi:hypothetical protein